MKKKDHPNPPSKDYSKFKLEENVVHKSAPGVSLDFVLNHNVPAPKKVAAPPPRKIPKKEV